jgi:hypothetical protein
MNTNTERSSDRQVEMKTEVWRSSVTRIGADFLLGDRRCAHRAALLKGARERMDARNWVCSQGGSRLPACALRPRRHICLLRLVQDRYGQLAAKRAVFVRTTIRFDMVQRNLTPCGTRATSAFRVAGCAVDPHSLDTHPRPTPRSGRRCPRRPSKLHGYRALAIKNEPQSASSARGTTVIRTPRYPPS